MSNVNLHIGGRSYNVTCAPGEEEHVAMLGRHIDEKVRTMGGAAGQSESRSLLFAALLLADDLHELRHRDGAPPPDNTAEIERLCGAIDAAAERLEKLAEHLEQAAAGP